ncbi:hypothetical protein QN277_028224 [Acacia crassicarpa]|uniref:BOD1/SHG1 domain-containing protein n=1 Tax=Acacia crassicarpa TaxID=499986 RepID=A0AAE1J2L5_9FABA|nr:hypothetical protein QN277_028224 [Acacia crassicarpa]
MEDGGRVASKEDVIAKLKDDGDFDRLRLKIVRKLKENEELREHIISIVRQSVVLNRDGAENMKPRQLSDAIYEEVGDKVMSQISNSLWQIIRSDDDGMKSEIIETVQSVYDKLVNPKGKDEAQLSTSGVMPFQPQVQTALAAERDDTLLENEPNEPPGFTLSHNHLNNHHDDQNRGKEQANVNIGVEGSNAEQKEEHQPSQETYGAEDASDDGPPGFSIEVEHIPSSDCGDEDPDVPPGFG